MFHLIVSVFVLLIYAGCATQRPVLYPNEQLQRVGSSVADDAINECMRRAEEYVASNGQTGRSVQGAANEAATSATIGAAAGQQVGRSSVAPVPEPELVLPAGVQPRRLEV